MSDEQALNEIQYLFQEFHYGARGRDTLLELVEQYVQEAGRDTSVPLEWYDE